MYLRAEAVSLHGKALYLHSAVLGKLHYETVLQVYFDPKETNYSALLDCFFDHVDPTTLNQQGNDRGTQYRSGIYYHNEEQKAAAEKVSAYMFCKAACVSYMIFCFALAYQRQHAAACDLVLPTLSCMAAQYHETVVLNSTSRLKMYGKHSH